MLFATHDGTFHADETVASAVLSYLYENCSFVRSRDPRDWEQADLVYDVSGINDARHFDHHSNDFTLERPNGIKYATAGLIWKKFGLSFLSRVAEEKLPFEVTAEILQKACSRVDEEFMQLVDLNDNGQLTAYLHQRCRARGAEALRVEDELSLFLQSVPDVPYLVTMMNLPGAGASEQDKNFLSTVRILRTLLVGTAVNALAVEHGISRVLEIYRGGELLIMHEKLPWSQAVFSRPESFRDCLLAVYPDRPGRWRVQSLPVSRSRRFASRLPAPVPWRGLSGAALAGMTGIAGAAFVHKTGFTGGADSYEDNLRLARLWLEQGRRADAAGQPDT